MDVKYRLSSATLDYANIKYIVFGISHTTGVVKGNQVNMRIWYEDPA